MKFLLVITLTILITFSTAQYGYGPRPRYGGYGNPYGQPRYGNRSPYGYPYRYPYGYGYPAPGAGYRPGPYNPSTPRPLQPTQPTQECNGPCVNGVCPAGYACSANNMCCRVGM